MTTISRACYFVAADGQSDVLLVTDSARTMTDAEMIEAAVREAARYECGLIGSVVGIDQDTDEETLLTEQDVRDGLRIGEYEA